MTADRRSLFWIEPATISGLLATVGAPTGESGRRAPAYRARVGSNGQSDAVVADRRPIQPPARVAPGEQPPAPSAWPRLILPRRPFEARLTALIEWLAGVVDFTRAFVIDADGLPLVEREAGAELVASAAALGRTWHALVRSGELDERTSVALELGGDEPESSWLHLLATETRWGMLQLGFVTARRLGRSDLDAVRDAFSRTVDDQSTPSQSSKRPPAAEPETQKEHETS